MIPTSRLDESLARPASSSRDGGIVQEAEERGPFAVEMCRETAYGGHRARLVQQCAEARLQLPTRDGESMVGDLARHVAVTQPQCLLEDVLHLMRQRRPGMIGLQVARTAEEMLHARLMRCVVESPIGCPSIPHQDAAKVGAQRLLHRVSNISRQRLTGAPRLLDRPFMFPCRSSTPFCPALKLWLQKFADWAFAKWSRRCGPG